ncbi:MAG: HD domain-containing protein [Synergistales bacterium]|nr:HD domain-containing protein [Synergistales bacterium]
MTPKEELQTEERRELGIPRTAAWFEGFVASYADPEGTLHPMMELKRKHSYRVAGFARRIAEGLEWEPRLRQLATAVGLLHDVGRFPQYATWQTFLDRKSVDHGEEGYRALTKGFPFGELCPEEKEELLAAVRYHNKKSLPDDLPEAYLPLARLIRDADKLDVFEVVGVHIDAGTIGELLPGIDREGPVSPAVADEVRATGQASYDNVSSLRDFLTVQLTWVYDLNYPPSFGILSERNSLRHLVRFLQPQPQVADLVASALDHVERASAQP